MEVTLVVARPPHTCVTRSLPSHTCEPPPLPQDLESAHNSVQRRLSQARANDGMFNSLSLRPPVPPLEPPQQDSPSRRGERIRYIPPTGFG